MGPSDKDRLAQIEEQLETQQRSLREAVTIEVSAAIKGAVAAMQQSLLTRVTSSFDEITKLQDEKLAAAITRLEGRITRSRDTQESLIAAMRDDQLKFQEDVRSSLSTFQSGPAKGVLAHENVVLGVVEGSGSGVGPKGGFYGGIGSGSGGGPGSGGYRSGGGFGSGTGPGGGAGPNGRNSWRHKKLDLPLFDGSNPDGWILRAERFFNFYSLSEEEKVEATVVALEGQALLWFQWEHRRRPIESWEQVKSLLRRQFRSQATGTLQEQWLAHRQAGTVTDYRLKFIELLAPLKMCRRNYHWVSF